MKKISHKIISLPMRGASRMRSAVALRIHYVADQANYAVVCSNNESFYYGVETGLISDMARRMKIYVKGGVRALFSKVPDHFALRYECDTTSEMIELCSTDACTKAADRYVA